MKVSIKLIGISALVIASSCSDKNAPPSSELGVTSNTATSTSVSPSDYNEGAGTSGAGTGTNTPSTNPGMGGATSSNSLNTKPIDSDPSATGNKR